MCMGSLSFLLLGGMYFVIDVKGWWAGQPFIYPGRPTVYSQIKGPNVLYWCVCFGYNKNLRIMDWHVIAHLEHKVINSW